MARVSRAVCVVVGLAGAGLAFLLIGCQSIPTGSNAPLVRDVTPEDNRRLILDEAIVPTEQLKGTVEPVPGEEPSTEQVPLTEATAETGPEEAPVPEPLPPLEEAAAPMDSTPPPVSATGVPMVDVDQDGMLDAPPAVSPAAALSDVGMVGVDTLAGPEYRIRPGDVLEFQSFDDEFLNRPDVVVRYDGYVSLPLIPDVKLEGLTREEAIDVVREAYKTEFRDPRLTLRVAQNSRSYFIMGDVRQPSEYPYTRPLSVIEAINRAGGLRGSTDRQNSSSTYMSLQGQLVKAFVIRHQGGERHTFSVDLRDIISSGPHASETPVLPDDIIYVPEGLNLIYVLGEAGRSDVFQLTQGMTLLQLLAVAGGPRFPTARLSEVVLLREVNGTHTRVLIVNVKQMLKTGRSIELKPGDIIFIPRKRLVQAQEFVNRFTGTVTPVMSLYRQVYDTYYTAERYEAIFDEPGGANNVLGILQGLRDVSNVLTPLATLP